MPSMSSILILSQIVPFSKSEECLRVLLCSNNAVGFAYQIFQHPFCFLLFFVINFNQYNLDRMLRNICSVFCTLHQIRILYRFTLASFVINIANTGHGKTFARRLLLEVHGSLKHILYCIHPTQYFKFIDHIRRLIFLAIVSQIFLELLTSFCKFFGL